ncbi:MAG: hypothetical protein R2699_03465 [Acidimicrobiales bacterium]
MRRCAAAWRAMRCDDLHVGDLERAAADPHAVVRRRAAELIGHHGPRRSNDADEDPLDRVVEVLLADAAATVVDAAAWAAGERWGLDDDGEPTGAPPEALALLVDHARFTTTPWCGRPASPLSAPSATRPARPPSSRRWAVRRCCAGGPCWRWRRSTGPTLLLRCGAALEDRDRQVRQAAEDLLDARPQP